MMSAPSDSTRFIHDMCRELGFARSGVCAAAPTSWPQELLDWLAAGKHGEMDYLAHHTDQRLDPRRMQLGAVRGRAPGEEADWRSIICVADRYHDGSPDRPLEPGRGRIARYARGDDYHSVMKKRLHQLCDALHERFPDESFRGFVDTAPVLEREHAARAGLGAIGKHTLLIDTGVGSYLLLGEVFTTLELEPSESKQDIDPCGTCTRCIDACPTDAITPWSVDATRCVSYLTIEHRSAIDERYHGPMGEWIFGCDICQEVCPHNHPTERSKAAPTHEAYETRRDGFDLLEVLGWTEDDRRAAFTKSAMKRAKLAMMKRNALIVAGHALRKHELPALRRRVREIAADKSEDEPVRATAATVLERCTST